MMRFYVFILTSVLTVTSSNVVRAEELYLICTIPLLQSSHHLVAVIDMNANGLRSDTTTAYHPHLFCLSCPRIVDIHLVDGVEIPIPQDSADFEITNQQIIYYGYCPDCKK